MDNIGYDQIIRSDARITRYECDCCCSKCCRKNILCDKNNVFVITILDKDAEVLMYQVYNEKNKNPERLVFTTSQKKLVKRAFENNPDFTPTTIMEYNNRYYAFVIHGAEIIDGYMTIYAVMDDIVGSKLAGVLTSMNNEIYNDCRFDIDCSPWKD